MDSCEFCKRPESETDLMDFNMADLEMVICEDCHWVIYIFTQPVFFEVGC